MNIKVLRWDHCARKTDELQLQTVQWKFMRRAFSKKMLCFVPVESKESIEIWKKETLNEHESVRIRSDYVISIEGIEDMEDLTALGERAYSADPCVAERAERRMEELGIYIAICIGGGNKPQIHEIRILDLSKVKIRDC